MCESCEGISLGRREFLTLNSALGASVLMSNLQTSQATGAEPVLWGPRRRPTIQSLCSHVSLGLGGKRRSKYVMNQELALPGCLPRVGFRCRYRLTVREYDSSSINFPLKRLCNRWLVVE
jgi:hypothetical protein